MSTHLEHERGPGPIQVTLYTDASPLIYLMFSQKENTG